MNFNDIMSRGKKKFVVKDTSKSKWGKCEYCEERRKLHPYNDSHDEPWMLCEQCIEIFIKEEG